MSKPDGLICWLERDKNNPEGIDSIAASINMMNEYTDEFILKATFKINGSVLIKGQSMDENTPDSVHIHSFRNNKYVPIISGTSLASALRARAYRIINTIGASQDIVDGIFGSPREERKDRTVGRLWISESTVEDARKS
jgi:hypothetical protein